MGNDIVVTKVNEAFAFVDANERISKEVANYFAVFVDNYRFMPKYKSGWWDGKIRFFDESTGRLPIGLVHRLHKFAKGGGYTLEIFNDVLPINEAEFGEFIESLNITIDGKRITPRDYQAKAAYEGLRYRRLSIESKTGSGKSLIIYIIIRFLLYIKAKILLVVPRTNLVEQMAGDFEEYGWNDALSKMHKIHAGQKKVFDAPVICSTWQSIYKDNSLFAQFDAILIDEAHNAQAKSLTRIAQNAINAQHRLGFSGTYHEIGENTTGRMTVEGNLGPIKQYTTYDKLIEDGHLSDLKIYGCKLEYPTAFKKQLWTRSQGEYQKENDLLIQIPERNELICKMVDQCDKNCLVLFTKIEKHGKPLLELFKKKLKDRLVLYIDGSVSKDDREHIRFMAEQSDNVVILASYGTFAEGVNIKNIYNVFFASSYKSKIKVLQALGRGLRKFKNKVLKLFDIVDNISLSKTPAIDSKRYVCHAMKHYAKRKKLYLSEGFKYKEVKLKLQPKDD